MLRYGIQIALFTFEKYDTAGVFNNLQYFTKRKKLERNDWKYEHLQIMGFPVKERDGTQ